MGRKAADRIVLTANAFWNIANFRAGLVKALVERGYRVLIAAPGADPDWAAARGCEAADIPIDRSGLNPLSDLHLLIQYRRLLRRTGARTLISFTAKPNIYGCMAAGLGGVRAIPNVSGLGTAFMADGFLASLVGWLYRIAFRRCPLVYFQNPDDRDLFLQRKIVRPHQARLLPGSGVDLAWFTPAPAATDGTMRFLFVGRLLGDKGVREYFHAARILKEEHPEWVFELLGPIDSGNRTGVDRTEIEQWTASGSVVYLGEAEDVRPFIAAATAVILPSYREGLPRSLLEAAAMARPLIASDVPGNREVVRPGVTGLLCAARDAQSLAEAMRLMGTMDPAERRSMGQGGRALAEHCYSQDRVVEAYLEALAQPQHRPGVKE